MNQIKIEEIIVKENIREDYGDLTELTASIKQYGVRDPLELDSSNVLVDGGRRLKSAIAAGLEVVPYFYSDEKVDKITSQILAGIFQKNLNPIEEGKAFRNYLTNYKIKVEELAKKISKPVNYIKKRLLLDTVSGDVKKALIDKKILLGHALLLAKLTKQDSSKYLKEIQKHNQSVEGARSGMQYSNYSLRLSDAKFDKKDCKNCIYNGSEQSELFETGKILNGCCMNKKCFQIKVYKFVKKLKEKYKDIIFNGESDYDDPKGYVDGSNEWQCNDKGVTTKYKKQCKKLKTYLVKVRNNGEVVEYFPIPKKKGQKAKTTDENTAEKKEQSLMSKVNDFKTKFLINQSEEMMQSGTKEVKALSLARLLLTSDWYEVNNISPELGNMIEDNSMILKNIFAAEEKDLDNAIMLISKNALTQIDLVNLIKTSKHFGVDIKKQFVITKEFLELHTKDQLISLVKELKLDINKKDLQVKKPEIIQKVLDCDLKGKVPKSVV